MNTIEDIYETVTGESGNESDLASMLAWFEQEGIQVSEDPATADSANTEVVAQWIEFRNSLGNPFSKYDREYLEATALEKCDASDYYDLQDTLGETSDGQLMAIAQIFD